jgi:hypothetical protein
MRRNVLTWLTAQAPNAHHALILTHNIHFLFVQSVLAAKLRQAGNPRLTIFADAACAAQAFGEQRRLIDGLGVNYRVVPVDLGGARRFHPKALLLTGPDRAVLAVGSGNLTHGGMAANHEAWAFGRSDGEGAPMIAAFRDYMAALAPSLPLAEPLTDGLSDLFDPAYAWVGELPPPSALVGSPNVTPLLDQIDRLVSGKVRAVSVFAPYHDANGVALRAIAERFEAPVTCWLQPGRVGLCRAAAQSLPSNVTLKSVDCEEARRPSFIHAKVLAFHREADVVLAVGSANCSKAALLAQQTWGNAELMAVDVVSHELAEAFFSGLAHIDEAPVLPDAPPSEGWETITPSALRILAARQEGDRLDIAYKSVEPLTDLSVEADAGAWPAVTVDVERKTARFILPLRLRTVVMSGLGPAGARITSPEAWVDDEASLAAPATLRRVFRRLQDGENATDPIQAFRGVLEIFRDYLRDPEAARRRMPRRDDPEAPPAPYDPAAVFSDHFGRAGIPLGHGAAAHTPAGVLSIIEALFAVSRDVGGAPPAPPHGEDAQDGEDPDPDAAEAMLIHPLRTDSDARGAAQLRRALGAMEQTLCEPAFVQARTASLLGADLAMVAILLVKGLADGLLDVATFRTSTRILWGTLLFGSRGEGDAGSLPTRVKAIADPAERNTFVAALATPRLAAALSLWSITEWNAIDSEALWFRLSAAQLQESCPWLFGAAAPDALGAEIQAMADALLPPNERFAAHHTWIEVVRAGESLRALRRALDGRAHADLRAAVAAPTVSPADLVWVNGRLAFPLGEFSRADGVKAQIRFLGQPTSCRYLASHLLPIRELINSDAVLDIPPTARGEILKLIEGAEALTW